MFDRKISADETVSLLDMSGQDDLKAAVSSGLLSADGSGNELEFRVMDLIVYRLALTMTGLGVPAGKAGKYAEAVLDAELPERDGGLSEWVDDEAQELICLISDNQLSRIFLRNKEDRREVEVGAFKPVLFPNTKCEINVFRVIRPVVYQVRKLFKVRRP
jgi:hypothetical protein